jgi:hypothetical protein
MEAVVRVRCIVREIAVNSPQAELMNRTESEPNNASVIVPSEIMTKAPNERLAVIRLRAAPYRHLF